MSTLVNKAQYYLIAPLRITNWESFATELEGPGWAVSTDANEFSLKEQIVDFLGMGKSDKSPLVASGKKWKLQLQKRGRKAFSYFKGNVELWHVSSNQISKDKCERELKILSNSCQTLSPSLELELYTAPNHKSALAVISFTTPENNTSTLEKIVETNYLLHKTDILNDRSRPKEQESEEQRLKRWSSFQAPLLRLKTGRNKDTKEDIYEISDNCLTIAHVLKEALPDSGYELDNPARLFTATYALIGATTEANDDEITEGLVHLGQSKDFSYEISSDEKSSVVHLFENIWTYNSIEGFACVAKLDGKNDIKFIKDFDATFKASYLPLFLTALMADQTYTSALRHLDQVATEPEEQNKVRDARLSITLTASHYDHLNRLMKSIVQKRDFEAKYLSIQSYIENRRLQIEQERIEVEKKTQRIESERKKESERERNRLEEAQKERDKKRADKDRDINLLLGFIGIGQVVFAIIQLLGIEKLAGACFLNSPITRYASFAVLVLFLVLIILVLVKAIKK